MAEPKNRALALGAIADTDAWRHVEDVAEEHLQRLRNIDEVEATGDPAALQVEVRARQLAVRTVRDILANVRSYGDAKPANPLTRSMK